MVSRVSLKGPYGRVSLQGLHGGSNYHVTVYSYQFSISTTPVQKLLTQRTTFGQDYSWGGYTKQGIFMVNGRGTLACTSFDITHDVIKVEKLPWPVCPNHKRRWLDSECLERIEHSSPSQCDSHPRGERERVCVWERERVHVYTYHTMYKCSNMWCTEMQKLWTNFTLTWIVYLHTPRVFQSLMVWSRAADTIWRLSAENATLSTSLVCPTNLLVVVPLCGKSNKRSSDSILYCIRSENASQV